MVTRGQEYCESAVSSLNSNMHIAEFCTMLCKAVCEPGTDYHNVIMNLTMAMGKRFVIQLLKDVRFQTLVLGRATNTSGMSR